MVVRARRAARGRGAGLGVSAPLAPRPRPGEPHPPGLGRLALFAGGALVILAALVSPIDGLGSQLMLMHMVQHVLLLDIAPILLILALTKGLLRPLSRHVHALERRAGYLAHPGFAVLAYAGLMWLWHVPALYDAALRHPLVHALEHVCFAVAGTLYWWHLLSPIRSRMRLGGMGPVLYMVSTKLLVGILGIVLAFAPSALYPFYEHHPHYWGLSPSEDQIDRRAADGARAVGRDGHRARLAVRADARRVRARGAEGRALRGGLSDRPELARRPRAGFISSAAPIAPPRSPSSATRTSGGRVSLNRCGCIAAAIRSANGCPKRTPSPPPMITASTSSRLIAEATPAPSARTARFDDPDRDLVAALERARPDAAGQPRRAALLHQLEQIGVLAPLRSLAGPRLHRRPPGVGLHAPAPAARATGAADLHDHVADLAGPAPAQPRLAVEDQPAADAGAPEHSQQRVVRTPGAEVELGLGRHLDVVADLDRVRRPRRRAPARARTFRPNRAGCARS